MNEEIKITCDNDVMKYSPDQLYDYIYKLQNNWNELKKFLEEGKKAGQAQENVFTNGFTINICNLILDKMQELEGNNE